MPLNVEPVRRCLKDFAFRPLFIQELGWDRYTANLIVAVDGKTYDLHALAEKRGFQIFECPAGDAGKVPDYATRCRIEQQAAKSAHEHIIIYTDAGKTVQKWQWVRRELGSPLARREYDYFTGATGEVLVQKLQYLAVDLADEENITLVDVARRARAAFDIDRVTKRFYDRFKTEHTAFLNFIKGITAIADTEWYDSLMLNRLMFVYFIQKKGFLAGDTDYLRNRLRALRDRKGKDKFLTFYRHFLIRLFHEGLGKPKKQRHKELDALLGEIPYLNGGLFDVHELEHAYPNIQIADEAFERLFTFFESYRWHLDERPLREDNEINPDVLGYIFEKYINQKHMGAYYTKEDITAYIARNTIIPFLFNAAASQCAAFQPGGDVWQRLRADPDRYLFAAVRKGVDLPLPPEIAAGVKDVARRDGWNRPAADAFALPTETWREHVARRQRCLDLRARMKAGEVRDINDFITYNLDLCQFAEDVIENGEGPDLVRAFYGALEKVSVLDPTCGSGAFLFAALNILESLYEACLDRMQGFVEDADRSAPLSPVLRGEGSGVRGEIFADFRRILEDGAQHANRRYSILKAIVVNNLYGVDIMREAVEICKLRLFLKLVAQVDRIEQLEPLPDIDFNIRSGNTLVGFASLQEVKDTLRNHLAFEEAEEMELIVGEAVQTEKAFALFRRLQTDFSKDAVDFSEAKAGLQARLKSLRDRLDQYLAGEYGIAPNKPKDFEKWHDSHQPFHWFAEFYGIMNGGGFDVIIGNPPYVEYSKVRSEYQIRGYTTLQCGNLYVFVLERCFNLQSQHSYQGLIVPLSLLCTDRMEKARALLADVDAWLPAFDIRPAALFEGVSQRLCIVVASGRSTQSKTFHAGGYRRWSSEERAALLPGTAFTHLAATVVNTQTFPKVASDLERGILAKIDGPSLIDFTEERAKSVLVHRICRYFIKALDFTPHFVGADGAKGKSEDYKEFSFRAPETPLILCLINSSLFYWFWRVHGDGFHCGYGDVYLMPFKASFSSKHNDDLVSLHASLMKSMKSSSLKKAIKTKKGVIEYQEFYPKHSKPIMDEIDRVLAQHYGFTAEELDFLINYDIKYRMGQEADDGEPAA